MKEIVVATKNTGKVKEIAIMLQGLPVKVTSLADYPNIPEAQETGAIFGENARLKAEHYVKYTGKACLADDSGLEVVYLAGAPGIYSARFAGEQGDDAENNKKLLAEMQGVSNRQARFRCAMVFLDTTGTILTTDGVCKGQITQQASGKGGFGYDPLFYVPMLGTTLAEVTITRKNEISHRGQAIRQMTEKLLGYLE